MNEENQTTKVKKGGKAKKIVIAIIAVIIIAAIVVGILLATGVLDVNLSKKSKMAAGVEKLGESFTTPFTSLPDKITTSGAEIKVLNNISKDSATEFSTELSAKIDELDIDELSTSEQSAIDTLKEILNVSSLGLDVRYDGKDSAYVNLNGKIDDVELSGEAVYDGSQLGIRSEEINSKWLVLKKADLIDLLEESEIDLDEIKKIASSATDQAEKLAKAVEIDEKTQKEIEERYSKILEDYINEKSKDIEKEKTKVEVDGKDKSCQKLTLELDEEDIKDLLKEYLKTFKNDSQIKDILTNCMDAYAEIAKEAGEEDVADELKDAIDELYNNIDEINDEIDSTELDVKLELVVYATTTNVYRTDIIINADSGKIKLETTFNKESTVMEISASMSGVSMDIAKITLKEKENGVNLKVEPSEMLTKEIGANFTVEVDYTIEEKKSDLTIKVDAGDKGTGTISIKTDITKNEDKAYEETSTISVDANVPSLLVAKMSFTAKTSIKVGDVSIPTISDKDAVDMTDETEVSNYMTESEEAMNDLLEKLESIDALESIIDSVQEGEITSEIQKQLDEIEDFSNF